MLKLKLNLILVGLVEGEGVWDSEERRRTGAGKNNLWAGSTLAAGDKSRNTTVVVEPDKPVLDRTLETCKEK